MVGVLLCGPFVAQVWPTRGPSNGAQKPKRPLGSWPTALTFGHSSQWFPTDDHWVRTQWVSAVPHRFGTGRRDNLASERHRQRARRPVAVLSAHWQGRMWPVPAGGSDSPSKTGVLPVAARG